MSLQKDLYLRSKQCLDYCTVLLYKDKSRDIQETVGRHTPAQPHLELHIPYNSMSDTACSEALIFLSAVDKQAVLLQVLAASDGELSLQMGMIKVSARLDEVRRKR